MAGMTDTNTTRRGSKVLLLQTMIAVAKADGDFAEVERERIEQLIDFVRLGPEARAEVEAMLEAPEAPPLPRPDELPSYEHRMYLFQQALMLAYEDDVIEDSERRHLEQLAEALELRDEDVSRGWQRARELRER